jgi:hypothetical protein
VRDGGSDATSDGYHMTDRKRKLYTPAERKAEYWKRKEFLKSIRIPVSRLARALRTGRSYR